MIKFDRSLFYWAENIIRRKIINCFRDIFAKCFPFFFQKVFDIVLYWFSSTQFFIFFKYLIFVSLACISQDLFFLASIEIYVKFWMIFFKMSGILCSNQWHDSKYKHWDSYKIIVLLHSIFWRISIRFQSHLISPNNSKRSFILPYIFHDLI